jgi:hypothetical protein
LSHRRRVAGVTPGSTTPAVIGTAGSLSGVHGVRPAHRSLPTLPGSASVGLPPGRLRRARRDRQRCGAADRTRRRAGPTPSHAARSTRERAAHTGHTSGAHRTWPAARRRRSTPRRHRSASRPPDVGSRCASNAVVTSPPHAIAATHKAEVATRRNGSASARDPPLPPPRLPPVSPVDPGVSCHIDGVPPE